jgi:uncharacterized protein (TIGR02145 family)
MTMLAQNGKISYQAVVRDSENHLVYDTPLQVTVALANSETGTAVYSEQHNVTSNANGLISLLIGDGTALPGSDWNAVQWNTAWVTATIRKGGESIALAVHHLPLSAVPYALYADFADSVDLDVVGHYLEENGYVTEDRLPVLVQSDWAETNADTVSFIKNKPDLGVYAKKDTLANFVANAHLADTLRHYYTKAKVDDTLSHYLMQESQILRISHDTIFLTGGSFVKLPAGFSGSYHDLVDTPTTVSVFDNDAGYLTEHQSLEGYVTQNRLNDTLDSYYTKNNVDTKLNDYEKKSELCGDVKDCIKDTLGKYATNAHLNDTLGHYLMQEVQMLSISHDTIFLSGGGFVKLPAGFSGSYHDLVDTPTTVSVFDNDAGYLTEHQSLEGYVTQNRLNDTLDSYYTKNNVDTKLNDYEKKSELCGDVKDCIKDTLGKYTTSNQIDTLLRAYYDTTHTKSVISDTAIALRAMMVDAANDGQLAIIAAGDTTRFTANQATNDTVRLNKFATKDTLSKYTTSDQIDTLLDAYATTEDLANYERQDNLCRDVKICIKDTLSKYTTTNQLDTVIRKYGYVTTTHLNDTLAEVYNTIRTDSSALHKAIKDTAVAIRADICDSATACITKALANPTSEINQAIDTIAGDAIHDSLTNNVKLSSKNDSIFLKRGNAYDTVKLPAAPAQVQSDWNAESGPASILNKPTISDATVNVNLNGSPVGSFTLNQATDANVILQNLAITNVANTFTGNNKFTGVDTFAGKKIVTERGFSFDAPKTTTGNCQVMVNACDLLAVFDSLAKRIDTLSKRFDSLKKANDSLADELDDLRHLTPDLLLSSDKETDLCNDGENGGLVVTYKASLLGTKASFYYTWYMNNDSIQGGTADSLRITYGDTSGVFKVMCKATRGSTMLMDTMTTKISKMPVFGYTILGGNSADFGRIRIDSSTAISAVWKDEDGNVIGNWNSGLTETLPVGKYIVVLLDGKCDKIDTIRVIASPMCPVGSLNETETVGSYTFNVEEGVTRYGRQYVTQIYDFENNLYNVMDIGGVCWTRENMRSTIYCKHSTGVFYNFWNGTTGYNSNYPNQPYRFEMPEPQLNGYLYTKSAAAAGGFDYPTAPDAYIRGICPEGWHLPSYNDVSIMLDTTGARPNAGKLAGALTSAADTSWTECNTVTSATGNYDYAERNITGFSAIRSGYIDASYIDTEPFNDDGAYFWVSRNHDGTNYPNWFSYALRISDGCSKDIDFGEDAFASHEYNALSVRCVRDMQPSLSISSSEGNNVSSCGRLSVPVTFTAKIHNDDADGYQYSWNGAAATSSNTFSASYSSSGNYTVSCTATKGEMTLTATYKIKVGCVGIDTCVYNLTVTVVGTMGGPTSIDWGDGQTTNGVTVNSTFHTYGTAGTYNIQVSDNDGNIETLTATVSKPHTTV